MKTTEPVAKMVCSVQRNCSFLDSSKYSLVAKTVERIALDVPCNLQINGTCCCRKLADRSMSVSWIVSTEGSCFSRVSSTLVVRICRFLIPNREFKKRLYRGVGVRGARLSARSE